MKVSCVECSGEFEAKRSSARFCSSTCRSRGNRKKPAEAAEAPAEQQGGSSLAGAVRAELEAAGRLETSLGQQALVLAVRIGAPDTGSGLAALSKELRALMIAATKGASVEADPVDELRARRDRIRSSG